VTKFHEWRGLSRIAPPTVVQLMATDPKQAYRTVLRALLYSQEQIDQSRRRDIMNCITESAWALDGRPYYRVWPKILDVLLRLDLETIRGSMIKALPYSIAIHLPDTGAGIKYHGAHVESIFVSPYRHFESQKSVFIEAKVAEQAIEAGSPHIVVPGDAGYVPGITVQIDAVKGPKNDRYFEKSFCSLQDAPIENALQRIAVKGLRIPVECVRDCVRLYCTICMIDNKECNLVDRIDKEAKAHKLEKATEDELLEAIADMSRGFDIGAGIEVMPHVRRPHFGIRWCETGKQTPRIVPIRGSIIHKDKIEEVPTGRVLVTS